jgi:Na+/proline symporter
MYRRFGVFTAYEFLGRRFDWKTRLLGAGLFLLQRGFSAGVTIYAPAIILSTMLGWRLDLIIIFIGFLVIVYTVTGGSEAVSLTQKWQFGVIFVGMVAAFIVLLIELPASVGFDEALHVAGALGKLQAVDTSIDPSQRYTLWTGLLGGLFLALSYFGTDQSQVQRYLGGDSLRESRLGLMFNALLKIPMQFLILLLGALLFVFYQFERPPLFFNQPEWQRHAQGPAADEFSTLEKRYVVAVGDSEKAIRAWLQTRTSQDPAVEPIARTTMLEANRQTAAVRSEAKAALLAVDPRAKTKDSDYVFITFILAKLPHGLIGLLIAVIFAAALNSLAAELNALSTTTTIDFWRYLHPLAAADEMRNVRVARWFTAIWGFAGITFALLAGFAENLIEAVNIVGSIFYGVVLGIFLVAFFLRRVGGSAVFFAAVAAQSLVITMFLSLNIGYLWYNLIGCAACIAFSVLLQMVLGPCAPADPGRAA